jgi:2-polyprenyl-3-methyl-5-hydroxy-6-metoxy-1,4-benzoquinol methylase
MWRVSQAQPQQEGLSATLEDQSMVADLTRRSDETELMDAEDISFEEFHACLQELETINHVTLAYRPTLRWLRPRLRTAGTATVLDAGSGGGDMLRQIEKRLSSAERDRVDLIGVDLNPWSKKSAELSAPSSSARHATADIFNFEPDKRVDFIICSLFTHHLTNEQLIRFLRWIDGRARRGWFINDLHRHPVPYHFIKAATHLFSRNRLIRNDAAVSVARSFTKAEWRHLLHQAGIGGQVRIHWFFPFRLCLSCDKWTPQS